MYNVGCLFRKILSALLTIFTLLSFHYYVFGSRCFQFLSFILLLLLACDHFFVIHFRPHVCESRDEQNEDLTGDIERHQVTSSTVCDESDSMYKCTARLGKSNLYRKKAHTCSVSANICILSLQRLNRHH